MKEISFLNKCFIRYVYTIVFFFLKKRDFRIFLCSNQMASALVDLLQPALPYFVAIQNPSFDFGGVPRVAAAVMRVRSLVGSLSLAADLLLSYLVVCAGGHARNLLLSEPFVGVVSAQSLFPVFLVVWLLAVGTNLLAFLPLKLVAVVLNALSRVRSVSLAVSAAALVLGDQNKIGIAIVGIAQASGEKEEKVFFFFLIF